MCGIAGIVSSSPVNLPLYDALTVLQHRGQDAAGICTLDGGRLNIHKGNGLVRDVFRRQRIVRLKGNAGIGHVRYPTAGSSEVEQAQPLYVNSPFGICMAHNGNLTNSVELESMLIGEDLRHLNTESDSELLLNVFAHELQQRAGHRAGPGSSQGSGRGPGQSTGLDEIFEAVRSVHSRCVGAYAVVALIVGKGVLAFRDPLGIRPAVIGRRETEEGVEHMVASESVALDMLGFEFLRDVRPGEAVLIALDGSLHARQCAASPKHAPCIFEYVYFARPDSILDGISVYKARLRMGDRLAEKILREWPDRKIDVVIPIPDTSRTAAVQVAYALGAKNREGFIKNRYIGRTFIMPGQKDRVKSVRRKLNAIDLEFRGKDVLLVDDSIVRGTTSRQIIEMAREAGARKVYFASAAPPVRFPNVYGIDMPVASELIAHNRSEQEIATLIGADGLIYQDLDDLVEAVIYHNVAIREFDTSVFSGQYVTGGVTPGYLRQLEQDRSDAAKARRERLLSSLADESDNQGELFGAA